MDFSPKYILSNYFNQIAQINKYHEYYFESGLWKKLDNGDIKFEDLIHKVEMEEMDDKYQLINFLKTWNQHKWERKEMTKIVKKLANNNYSIHLCSNASSSLYNYIDNYEVFQYFDSITISADYKVSKPNSKIYQIVLQKNNLKAEDCLFVDDLIENIKAAEKIGIDGYHYNGNELMFKKFLNNLNIL